MALKVQALFKGASKAPKAAAKKAVVKPSGTKSTRGWLGGAGGAQNLDKWYGEFHRVHWKDCQKRFQKRGCSSQAQIVLNLGSILRLIA